MSRRLTSIDLSVEELLSGRYQFSIPPYQRDYSWTREEVNQLIDDLASAADDQDRSGGDTPYFIGTMLFVTQGGNGAQQPSAARPALVDVVDGQQRLITLQIFLAVARDLAADEDKAELHALLADRSADPVSGFQLRLRGADEEFLRRAILAPGAARRADQADGIKPGTGRANIDAVRKVILSRLQKEFKSEERKALIAFVRRHARVLVVTCDDFDYAYQIFLTINDRGIRLSVEDIFRGEIVGPLDQDQRTRYEAIIDEMDRYRQPEEKKRAKGKTFFSHLAAIYGWVGKAIVTGLRQAVHTRGGPKRFAADVFEPMAEAYLTIKGAPSARPVPVQLRHYMTGLRWLEQHGDDDWIAAAMLGLVRLVPDSPEQIAYFRALDRFAHALMALGCGAPARKRHYTPILKRLVDAPKLPPAEEAFALSKENQRQMLRFVATRLHNVDPPTAKLILLRLDAAVSGRPLSSYEPLLSPDQPLNRLTVEHVCPKGDVRNGGWLDLFPRRNRRLAAAECIGNLVLVTEAQNRRADQQDWERKRSIFFPDGTAHPLVLTDAIRNEPVWDGHAIGRRYALLMEAVKSLWSIEGVVPRCPAMPLS